MKTLFTLLLIAFTVAIAADDKPKAASPAQTVLTGPEHDELTKLFMLAQAQDIAAREAKDAATKAFQEFQTKQAAFQKLHNALGCTWAFFDKVWSCPPV